MRIIDKQEGWIGHRLNLLGIRVYRDRCQLVAKTGDKWMTLGPSRSLPVAVPRNAEELASAASDPLLITAYQYMGECPDSDLAYLLAQTKNVDDVLNGRECSRQFPIPV